VHFYEGLVRRSREAIVEGRFEAFRRDFLAGYAKSPS
jgi:queuine/archaeosine tRNA-ribosyltransferase